jgi:dTDP-4-dehydrorhamnose reductase
MAKVWVTGAQGLIGSHIVTALQRTGGRFEALPIVRQRVDLECYEEMRAAFRHDDPAVVVHCAAYSDTAYCEAHPERAFAVNMNLTASLAELARDRLFIFFSTDLVFDGKCGQYTESSAVGPLSVYARSKVMAEAAVLANPRHAVVRTSMTAGPSPRGNKGFDESLVTAWHAGRELSLFVDEFRNPIAAEITARAVCEMITKSLTGLFHLAGSERLSRYQIGALLAVHHPELKPRIRPGTIRDFPDQARPADCSLDSAKLQGELSFVLPAYSAWLERGYRP